MHTRQGNLHKYAATSKLVWLTLPGLVFAGALQLLLSMYEALLPLYRGNKAGKTHLRSVTACSRAVPAVCTAGSTSCADVLSVPRMHSSALLATSAKMGCYRTTSDTLCSMQHRQPCHHVSQCITSEARRRPVRLVFCGRSRLVQSAAAMTSGAALYGSATASTYLVHAWRCQATLAKPFAALLMVLLVSR